MRLFGRTTEIERLSALSDLQISTTATENHLDAVCRIAASLFDVPIALITLIDEATVWIKASNGVDRRPVPRCDAFCTETIESVVGDALVLADLALSERWRDSPLVVGGPNALFYAGVPIALETGVNIGTICIMDTVARPAFGKLQTKQLHDLASVVEAHLSLHQTRIAREREEDRYRLLADNSSDVIIRSDLDSTRRYVSPSAKTVFGYEPEEFIGAKPFSFIHPDNRDILAKNMRDLANAEIERGVARQRYRHKDGGGFGSRSPSASCVTPPLGGPTASCRLYGTCPIGWQCRKNSA